MWVYVAGPFLGASLAVLFMGLMHSHKKQGEDKAAMGHGDK